MTPDAIGRYQVFAQLGEGGFATVYRAYDPRLDRDVAIKVLHPLLARDPAMRDRFLQEARALASVRHQHLVRLFDAGEADGLVYLTMEFIPGRSLDAIAFDGLLPIVDVVRIIGETAAALDVLHAAGLVHRDIKPANIMLADDGRAMLVDLGIARSLSAESMTSSSMVLGTPGFLAPEQLSDSAATSPRTDVYQLAATAYTLLTGRPLFEGSPAEVLYALTHRPAPDLQALCPDLPAGIAAVVKQGLAKEPSRRPATAGEFAAALSSASLPPTLLMPRPPRPSDALDGGTAPSSARQERAAHVGPVQRSSPKGVAGAQPSHPRRRAFLRWPLAVAAAGAALILLGGSAVAVSQTQRGGADEPGVTVHDTGAQASPAPNTRAGGGSGYRAATKPIGAPNAHPASHR